MTLENMMLPTYSSTRAENGIRNLSGDYALPSAGTVSDAYNGS